MSWKKHFRSSTAASPFPSMASSESPAGSGLSSKFASYLPEVFAGHPNRIQRYYQYDDMDRDSDINAALDTIADFCTQSEEQSDKPFEFKFNGEMSETEIKLLNSALTNWTKLNTFRSRLWHMFRNCIKNGDQFFLRDPETFEWLWIDSFMVELVKVDDSKGKVPDEYIIRGLDLNRQAKFATVAADPSQYRTPLGTSNAYAARPAMSTTGGPNVFSLAGSNSDPRQRQLLQGMNNQLYVVDAKHVIHLSLSVGMDVNWPFGQSMLEPIFKTYKQKELLEDSIIIYRIQRAPERRVFYIDTGSMPPARAKAHLESVKNEIHQRRIPSRCLDLATKIPLLDGRVLPLLEIIAEYNSGKQNWVYSCNPKTGKVVPGKITWAGETREQTQVIKLTLDNGKEIICTPDHKFPILGKGFVEAQNLEIGESFIPAYFREKAVNKHTGGYTQIFDNETKKWNFVHRLVANYFKNNKKFCNDFLYKPINEIEPKHIIHHIDINRYNNNPENLCWMGREDHFQYHADNASEWKQPIFYNETLFDMMHEIVISSSTTTNTSLSFYKAIDELSNNKEFMSYFSKINDEKRKKDLLEKFSLKKLKKLLLVGGFNTWNEYRDTVVKNGEAKIDYSFYRHNDDIFDIFYDRYMNSSQTTIRKIIKELKTDNEFQNEFEKLHENNRSGRKLTVSDRYIDQLMKFKGYNNFQDFVTNNRNPNYMIKRDNTVSKYNFSHEMLNILKMHYNEISKNLHYTVKEVGFKPLYQSIQKDVKFKEELIKANPQSSKNRFGPDLIKKMINHFGFDDFEDYKKKHEFLNHKLVSVEWLDDKVDTGTITVDGEEEFHDYHTFALDSGVFTKNSGGGASIMDAAYNPLSMIEDYFFAQGNEGRGSKVEVLPGGECLSLDTMIPLLDGRNLSLNDIISEHNSGKQLWAYSCNPENGQIVPGIINWAGITRKDTDVLKINLSNGNTITVTPDHKFPIKNKGKIEARNIEVGDNIIQFNKKNNNVFDYSKNEWFSTEEIIQDYFDGGLLSDMLVNDLNKNSKSVDMVSQHISQLKVVAIEYLSEKMDTGTITIDGLEIYHNYHTFALCAGVFTYNSTGDIMDLSYFTKKMARGLRIPSSYLSIGDDSAPVSYNDGKLGAALIQEFRFNKYCMRIQNLISPTFDKEFKYYLDKNGITIDEGLYELVFNPPQNFTKYRQIEVDAQQIQVYTQIQSDPVLSKRFKLMRYLNLTEDEIMENERMWSEENPARIKDATGAEPADLNANHDLSAVGVRGSDQFDLGGGGDFTDGDLGDETPETPATNAAPPAGPSEAPTSANVVNNNPPAPT